MITNSRSSKVGQPEYRRRLRLATGLAIIATTGCSSTTDANPGYTTGTYATDAYYATAVPYAGPYYGDGSVATAHTYAAANAGASGSAGSGGSAADGGTGSNEAAALLAIDAAAQNSMQVCPGHSTYQPKQGTTPCETSNGNNGAQAGYTVNFMGCQLENGATLDGSIDVSRSVTASDSACSSNTNLTINVTTMVTNLTYTASSGRKVVIKSLNDSATYSQPVGASPSAIMSQLNANIARYDANSNLLSDRTLSGQLDYSLSGSPPTVSITADLSVSNSSGDAGMGKITITDVPRNAACCYPTSGSISITGPVSETYMFGPACGEATKNGTAVTLTECP